MQLTVGIIGLPNTGKSTLFNALTKSEASASNYAFSTTVKNSATILLPDKRLDKLTEMYKPQKKTPATITFTDIPGLVRGSSKGEGLGNSFLADVREADAILHVVRCFTDDNIMHVDGNVDPLRDIETVDMELIFSDLEIIEKRLGKIQKKAAVKVEDAHIEAELLEKCKGILFDGVFLRTHAFNSAEEKMLRNYNFLTLKPTILIANISEDDLSNSESNEEYQKIVSYAQTNKYNVIPISAQLEMEINTLEEAEKEEYLDALGIQEIGLDRLIRASFFLLGLETFFTAGEKEVRAWTYQKGQTAQECAGIIHSDFYRGFIRAETVAYNDLLNFGGMQQAKANGKVRQEGKEYITQDGDIMLFKFNVSKQ